jgi:hypothetical protein
VVHGHPTSRLPNTLSIAFPGVPSNLLLADIRPAVAASAGAACHAGTLHASHVMRAMGVPDALGTATLRLTVGRFSTRAEVEAAAGEIVRAVHARRGDTGEAAVAAAHTAGGSGAAVALQGGGVGAAGPAGAVLCVFGSHVGDCGQPCWKSLCASAYVVRMWRLRAMMCGHMPVVCD